MNLGAIKGADHVVHDTAPQEPIRTMAGMDAYYDSPAPVEEYRTRYNEKNRGWKQLRIDVSTRLGWTVSLC